MAPLDAGILGSSEAWRLLPRVFAAARILFSFLLFLSILSFLVEKRVLTPNPYFYEFAGLVCLAVDVLVFSAFDLSASFYFIWALCSSSCRSRAEALGDAVRLRPHVRSPPRRRRASSPLRPDLSAYSRLIAPGFFGVLALSALTLPFFVFTASPLLFFASPGPPRGRRRSRSSPVAGPRRRGRSPSLRLWIATPVERPRAQGSQISELIDQDSGRFDVELAGLRRLGREASIARAMRGWTTVPRATGPSSRGEDRGGRIGIAEVGSPFLDRVDEIPRDRFRRAPPDSLEIALKSADEMLHLRLQPSL